VPVVAVAAPDVLIDSPVPQVSVNAAAFEATPAGLVTTMEPDPLAVSVLGV
jgi:hypothetical protein